MKTFLDTHAAVLLYAGEAESFGPASRDLMERSALFVSPFVRLELKLLGEIQRINTTPDQILGALEQDLGLATSRDAAAPIVGEAMRLSWTRDPFDRLLVATARLHEAPLVTRDKNIQTHYEDAIW